MANTQVISIAQENLPQTVAELSDFKSTSTSDQVIQFIDECDKKAAHVHKFVFGKTVEGRDMVGVAISKKPYELGQQDDRAVVLVIGNIHSGECAGKEALLMLTRQLTHHPDYHLWLDNCVLVIVPNYNADANDRMGKNNRPGQIGPENGMGRRENAQQLDLNRDFIKLESPEARALAGLMNKVNPHLFIDCHTTNGSKHQYALTYDVPHNPATAQPIRDLLRNKMMPEVTQRLKDNGTLTFYYGNFNGDHTTWTTYGHEPRYSTEYAGLRGRLAILSEAYSYISYKDRIVATLDFVSTCIDYIHEHAAEVNQLLQAVDEDLIRAAASQPSRIEISLNAKAVACKEKCILKGYKDDQPCDYECEFIGEYEATRKTSLPYAYLIPSKYARAVDRLLMHGIKVNSLDKETQLDVEVDTIKNINRAQRAFQKHKMVQAESQRDSESQMITAGTYVVQTDQPLGRLAAYMLECDSDDGLVFWNFFDEDLDTGKMYPVLRIAKPIELKTTPIKQVKKVSITPEMIDGPHAIDMEAEKPAWKDNQLIEESWGRKFLLDPESMSFNQMIEPEIDVGRFETLLSSEDIDADATKAIANSDPTPSSDKSSFIFNQGDYCVYFVPADELVKVLGTPKLKAELVTTSEDQTKLVFHNQQGLNVLDLTCGDVATFEPGNSNELLGKLDWVYQEELYGRGNFKGYWLSPDSKRIAFLKLDQSPVKKFTITDHIPTAGQDEFTSYPKAGDPNPAVQVGVASATDPTSTIWVDLGNYGDQDILVSGVTWNPDSSRVFLQIQNREQTWLDLVSVEASGNNPTRLFRDQTPAWIESSGDPQWTADGSFLWLSPRDGYKHLYQYSADGQNVKQLTTGPWEIRELVEFDKQNNTVYFMAAKETPCDLDAYRLELTTGETRRITNRPGTHGISFNKDLSYFIDSVSTADQPDQYYLCRADGTEIRRLGATSDDRLAYLDVAKPDFLTIDSAGGQPLDAMMIRPPNFDKNRKYPVLVYIYAGPQTPRVRNRFGGQWYLWHQMLAQKGYIVWSCDNRSASYRSAKNAWPIHRNLGQNELADIETGVDWLKQQPWVDADRIGIWGWSYGGYMTAYALTHSQLFKMGIAGAPVTDWRNYDSIYTERLMGTPQDNPDGYERSSVVKAAKDLHGNLLLIHGSIDDNVHLSNSMQLVYELQKAGKKFELMIYPKSRHSVTDKEQAAHLRGLMFEFIERNL